MDYVEYIYKYVYKKMAISEYLKKISIDLNWNKKNALCCYFSVIFFFNSKQKICDLRKHERTNAKETA